MSKLSHRPTVSREAVSEPATRGRPERTTAEPTREKPLLWSRAMQEARGAAARLARRAFPWRYY